MDTQRVAVADAAKEIGVDIRQLRAWMRNGVVDLGLVAKGSGRGERYEYLIFRAKLDKFLGKESKE